MFQDTEIDSKSSIANAVGNHTIYTCKLCHKDFSSNFILCLHLQIHQKVGSTPVTEDKEPSAEDLPAPEDDEEEEFDPSRVKLEHCEVMKELKDDCSEDTKEEISVVNTSPAAEMLNKNFVENLKKNLSLAMNRKL